MHIVAVVLYVIKQRGLDSRCRKLKKTVLRQSKMLKNLLEAAGLRDTVLRDVDVKAHKVKIEETQQLLQDFQKVQDEAIAKVYEQLQNLLSRNPQSQWDSVSKLHKHGLWAGVNGQMTKGRRCCKLHRYLLYKCTYVPYDGTFGASNQGQTLDV
jgi:hypothetical protein